MQLAVGEQCALTLQGQHHGTNLMHVNYAIYVHVYVIGN